MLFEQHHQKIFFKATLLFFSANVLITSLHELSHAIAAYFLNVHATLFHFYVDINQDETSASDQVIIALTGPLFSLAVGTFLWILYKKNTALTSKLFFLYAAILGISTFFGNLLSSAMVGDFGKATQLLQFSKQSRFFLSALGLLTLIAFMFRAGREFMNIGIFETTKKGPIIFNCIIIPGVLGTALVVLVYTPLPVSFTWGVISGSAFWIFSIIGLTTARPIAKTIPFPQSALNVSDIALFIISVLVVRILVSGIRF